MQEMPSVKVISAGVMCSLLLSGTSDASTIQKMLKDQRRILPLIGQFSDDQSRQSLSQVNQPLRTVVNRLRIQERMPDSQRKRKRQEESVDATVPCPQSKLEDCLNTVGEWNAKVAVFTEDQMVNVQGVPDSKKRKYDGTWKEEQLCKAPSYPVSIFTSGSREWIACGQQSRFCAQHVRTGSVVNLDQYHGVVFVDEVLAVAIAESKDVKYSLDLIMVSPDKPTVKVLRSVTFDPFPTNDPSLKITYNAKMSKDENKGSSEIKFTVRTFAKLLHSDKYRVRLTTFEMFSQKKIRDFFLKSRDGSYLELSEEQAKSDNHLMQKFLHPSSEMYFIDQSQPSQSWLVSTNVETEEQTELVPLLGKPKGFWISDDVQYAVVEIIGSSNPFALYSIRDGCMVGAPLPFIQRPKFYKWLSNEIFAMEETVFGEKSPHYFGVSVDKPSERFSIPANIANCLFPIPETESESFVVSQPGIFSRLQWNQPALQSGPNPTAQGITQLANECTCVGLSPVANPADSPQQQGQTQQQPASSMTAANNAVGQPAPMNNHQNVQFTALPMAAQMAAQILQKISPDPTLNIPLNGAPIQQNYQHAQPVPGHLPVMIMHQQQQQQQPMQVTNNNQVGPMMMVVPQQPNHQTGMPNGQPQQPHQQAQQALGAVPVQHNAQVQGPLQQAQVVQAPQPPSAP